MQSSKNLVGDQIEIFDTIEKLHAATEKGGYAIVLVKENPLNRSENKVTICAFRSNMNSASEDIGVLVSIGKALEKAPNFLAAREMYKKTRSILGWKKFIFIILPPKFVAFLIMKKLKRVLKKA